MGPGALAIKICSAIALKSARKCTELLFTTKLFSSGCMPAMRKRLRSSIWLLLELTAICTSSIFRHATGPTSTRMPFIMGPSNRQRPSDRCITSKRPLRGVSPSMFDCPPSSSSTKAPTPASIATWTAIGSTIRPTAAFLAPLRNSALIMPVVLESPPAPGLSCVVDFVSRSL
ncbi:hypothetical protein D3C77_386610 [compost metagenome]